MEAVVGGEVVVGSGGDDDAEGDVTGGLVRIADGVLDVAGADAGIECVALAGEVEGRGVARVGAPESGLRLPPR